MMLTPYFRGFRRALKPPDYSLANWQWCERHIVNDSTGKYAGEKWKSARTPFARKPMEDFQGEDVTDIAVMGAAQNAKSQPFLNSLAHSIVNDPGGLLWVSSSDAVLEKFAKGRMHPTLKNCAPVAELLPQERTQKGVVDIYFPTMLLSLVSALSEENLTSMPYQRVVLDEAASYRAGVVETAFKRTRTFGPRAKRVVIFTPALEGDSGHRFFLDGSQEWWSFRCPECAAVQSARFYWNKRDAQRGGLRWDTNEETKPAGRYRWEKLFATIRLECQTPRCPFVLFDRRADRDFLLDRGLYAQKNFEALPTHRSYTWSGLIPPWVVWADLVKEFLSAVEALKYGDPKPLQVCVNESFGETWRERDELEAEIETKPRSGYVWGEAWPEEEYRFLKFDVQKDHFWWSARIWAANGESRSFAAGGGKHGPNATVSYEQIREVQERLKIPDNWVAGDCRFNRTETLQACAKYGWTGLMALGMEHQKEFVHELEVKDPATGSFKTVKVQRIYSPEILVDAHIGTDLEGERPKVSFFYFADAASRNVLETVRRNGRWTRADDESADYKMQIDSWQKVARSSRTGAVVYEWVRIGRRPDHIYACERQGIVLAAMAGLIGLELAEKQLAAEDPPATT